MKKLLMAAAGLALVRWLGNAEREALDRYSKLPRLPPRQAVNWQAGTPSDALASRAEVVRQGTGW